jgi:glutathione S-transferase
LEVATAGVVSIATPRLTLFSLNVSPWSERVRWALDHHGLTYRLVEHTPILGERRLRRLVGRHKPRATVPVLVAGAEVVTESWDIARFADAHGSANPLVPSEHQAAIRAWVDLADEASAQGRAVVVAATLASGPALDAQLPAQVPSWLGPALRPVTRSLGRAFARKYGLRLDDAEGPMAAMRAALDRLRAELAVTRSPFLQGTFSYADIAMSSLVQGISPVADRFWKIPPATRHAWTHATLAAEYSDLIAWRDGLYEAKR